MYAKHVDASYGFRLITGVLLILLGITGSLGRLTKVPENNFVFKGATAEFTCCSDIQEDLFWKVKTIVSSSIDDIYDDGLVNGFRNGRFNVTDESRSGCYRLIIADIRVDDAGTYLCIDRQGTGQQIGWELVIVESFDCQEKNRRAEYMGENKFGLHEDVFSTVCISIYFGNIPPNPICGWSSGAPIADNHQHVTKTNFTSTVTIQMPARKEFNGDQLTCYLKIDGKAGDNKATTTWKSSHLVINYASFHQRGVSQCSVDDLFLDCQPPCNYKTVLCSNGSSYCEITYPSKTHEKFFVSLQDNNLPQPAFISSSTNSPVESQAKTSGILLTVAAVIVTMLVCALAGAIAIIIMLKRKQRQRPEMDTPETITLETNSGRGRNVIVKPGIVINMGDGHNVTVNTVYGDQQNSVTTRQENVPLLRAHITIDPSRTQGIPHSDPENVSVRGVAVLGEHLFFAYRGSSQVRVYSTNTLSYKTSWELKETTNPQDLTACNMNNCLYMSNIKVAGSECEILKVSPQGSLMKKWETGKNYFGRLSVTHDFNLLLAAHSNRKLVEYETNGTLLRKIQLPDALRPNYALKVNSDYFVSHGFGEDPVHGVSQVDAKGEVLKRFGDTKGSTNEHLDTPVHLVMNEGLILVADTKNGRVVVLSPTLEYEATLLSKEEDELGRPIRICIDHDNRRLLLSDFQHQSHFLRAFNFI